ncbi:uncharacterized protein LOC119095434 [Pollicipes pollicipes]|uniref:uncharacterized protein LOC119095434 n=1 Tax=Pollicipes pollicipes TaxID=41117 RepID=UPI001884F9B8|nr:uncharacterized protein LOC119095434 [Pollicipes pollicipes]
MRRLRLWCCLRLCTLQTFANLFVASFLVYNVCVYVSRSSQNEELRPTEAASAVFNPRTLLAPVVTQASVDELPSVGRVPPAADRHDLEPTDVWQNVTFSVGKFFVFSAYFERRMRPRFVRVIATGRVHLPSTLRPLYCRLHFSNGSEATVRAQHRVIKENWGLAYTARFVLCPTDEPPRAVSLFEKSADLGSRPVTVQDVQPSAARLGRFAVCVKPFHYEYNRAVWLVEFIEFHRLLGVSRFIFYNHTVGPDVERVLRFYQSRDLVTVLPWHIALRSQKEVRTENMFAALNDCLYRTMYRYSYTALVDVDEYIVPRQHADYGQLFDLLGGRGRETYGSYIFQNCFFYLYWENDTAVAERLHLSPQQESQFPYLISLYKTRRVRTPHRFYSRSKYLVVPERVVEAGNHQVWEHAPGFRSMNVGEHFGLVHHFRICEFGGFDCMKKDSIVDRTTHRFIRPLAGQVLAVCDAIFGGNCPVAPPLGSPW